MFVFRVLMRETSGRAEPEPIRVATGACVGVSVRGCHVEVGVLHCAGEVLALGEVGRFVCDGGY